MLKSKALELTKDEWDNLQKRFVDNPIGLMEFAAGYTDAWTYHTQLPELNEVTTVDSDITPPHVMCRTGHKNDNTSVPVKNKSETGTHSSLQGPNFPLSSSLITNGSSKRVRFYLDPVFRSLAVWTLLESCSIPYEKCLVNALKDFDKTMSLDNPFKKLPLLQIVTHRVSRIN